MLSPSFNHLLLARLSQVCSSNSSDKSAREREREVSSYVLSSAMQQAVLEGWFPSNFTTVVTEFKSSDDGGASCRLRANIRSEEECSAWITAFSANSKTRWIVRRTYPGPRRFRFRKDFACQHSSFNKTAVSDRVRPFSSRVMDKDCKASIVVKIKLDTKHVRRKGDAFAKRGLLCEIRLLWQHNHVIRDAESLSFNRILPNVREQFQEFFRSGMHVQAALGACRAEIELGEHNVEMELADAAVYPKMITVRHLYENWKTEGIGRRTQAEIIDWLSENLPHLTAVGAKLKFSAEPPFAVALVTPTMLRAHSLPMACGTCFVERALRPADERQPCVTMLMTASVLGELPLGLLLTNDQTEESYTAGLKLLQECFGELAFTGKLSPKQFTYDDFESLRAAVHTTWPQSALLASQLHFEQTAWRWLHSEPNGISKDHRQHLMGHLRRMMHSQTLETANAAYAEASGCSCACYYPNWTEYLGELWQRRAVWATAWRSSSPDSQAGSGCVAERTIGIYRDHVWSRVDTHSAVALLKFIIGPLERGYQRKLKQFAHGCVSKQDLLFSQHVAGATFSSPETIQLEDSLFRFDDRRVDCGEETFDVDLSIGLCSCHIGIQGILCKHRVGVWKYYPATVPNLPAAPALEKCLIGFVAGGEKLPGPHTTEPRPRRPHMEALCEIVTQFVAKATEFADEFSVPALQSFNARVAKIGSVLEFSEFLENAAKEKPPPPPAPQVPVASPAASNLPSPPAVSQLEKVRQQMARNPHVARPILTRILPAPSASSCSPYATRKQPQLSAQSQCADAGARWKVVLIKPASNVGKGVAAAANSYSTITKSEDDSTGDIESD